MDRLRKDQIYLPFGKQTTHFKTGATEKLKLAPLQNPNGTRGHKTVDHDRLVSEDFRQPSSKYGLANTGKIRLEPIQFPTPKAR